VLLLLLRHCQALLWWLCSSLQHVQHTVLLLLVVVVCRLACCLCLLCTLQLCWVLQKHVHLLQQQHPACLQGSMVDTTAAGCKT
jgi:hypothetical protein